jgi:rod shape determining protein RodA
VINILSILNRRVDLPLAGGLFVLCVLGLVVLFSASGESTGILISQAIRIGIGIFVMISIAHLSPSTLLRIGPILYIAGVLLLIVVAIWGDGQGARRWIDLGYIRFQPSEIMKLAIPIVVAAIVSNRSLPPSARSLFVCVLVIIVPVILIYLQPDLGTAILVTLSGLMIIFLGGISWRIIRYFSFLLCCFAPIAWYFIRDYQKQRILTLIFPDRDPLGAGYHIIQSKIAIGSGGKFGKGWLNGTQSHLEFLPERATDFIFAVYCEEFGFIGVLVLLMAYALIVIRSIGILYDAQDTFCRLLGGAIIFTFVSYIFVNIGMVVGLLPVVGVPLPLISYGGTSMVTILGSFGILMSIQTHKKFYANV